MSLVKENDGKDERIQGLLKIQQLPAVAIQKLNTYDQHDLKL